MDDYAALHATYDTIEALREWLNAAGWESSRATGEERWACPNPQHDDEHPSALLYDTGSDGRPRMHCFVCGWGGDIADLSRLTGIALDGVRPVTEVSTVYAQAITPLHNLVGEASVYWRRRGIADTVVRALGIITPTEGMHAGRSTIPITNYDGDVVSYHSRAVREDDTPRYRTEGPQVPWWLGDDMGAPVCVVTEGCSDAIAMFQAARGDFRVMSLLGANANLPVLDTQVLANNFMQVLVVGDADPAGQRFAQRIAEQISAAGGDPRGVAPPMGCGDLCDALAADVDLHAWTYAHLSEWDGFLRITPEMELPDEPWLIENFIPGGLTMFFGEPGTGKSWAGEDLAMAVSQPGRRWIGKQVLFHGPSLILDWENPNAQKQARLRQLRGDAQVWWKAMGATDLLSKPTVLRRVIGLIERSGARFVFVDSMSRAFGGWDENSAASANSGMGVLAELQQACDGAVVVLHHANKWGQGLNAVRGSTAITANFDAVWEVTHNERGHHLWNVKMRPGPEASPIHWKLQHDMFAPATGSLYLIPN